MILNKTVFVYCNKLIISLKILHVSQSTERSTLGHSYLIIRSRNRFNQNADAGYGRYLLCVILKWE